MRLRIRALRSSSIARVAVIAVAAALLVSGALAAGLELPQGPDRNLVYGQCRTCHDLQYLIDSAGLPRSEWAAVIENMRQFGLRIPAEQRARILDYLAIYLGPNPPAASQTSTPVSATAANGATLFNSMCIGCHQPDGRGVPGQFPPLAGNGDLYLSDDFPVLVLLFGMKGKAMIGDTTYQSEMPPFGHLSDGDIAALVNYVRSAWANDKLTTQALAPVEPAKVGALRGKSMSPEAVLAYRNSLL